VDNLDFYEEKVNPVDSGQYEVMGTWRDFEMRNVVIKTSKGGEVKKLLRFTRHGPVVSEFKKLPGKVVSMHWVGDEMSDEFKSVRMLNRANNWNEFKVALQTFTSISQNIVYADKKGNIGLFCAAGVPVRKRDIAFGVLPGQTGEYDWKGYVPFGELPYQYNPVTGFVASANNRTAPADYPYHIGSWYSLPSRYERITEMLSVSKPLSVEDFKAIQLDQHSRLAEKYLPVMIMVLKNNNSLNAIEKTSLDLLSGWDYNMDAKKAAPAIFETLYLHFIRCTFEDEMGVGLFERYNGITSLSRTATDQLFDAKESPWYDNVMSKDTLESMNDVILCAFRDAVSELESRLGNEPRKWQWGNIHRLVLEHPLAAVKILDKVLGLNRGPFPVGGSFHTVSPYSYDVSEPFDADHGSSHRHIFDVGDWDRSITVIPTGNSGIPASRHYCDQTDMYVKGIYHTDYFSKEKVLKNAKYTMKFNPQ
jgi:penicillin amidase